MNGSFELTRFCLDFVSCIIRDRNCVCEAGTTIYEFQKTTKRNYYLK